ncbi:MAG: dihydroorotate dehydrogenase [Acidobacteriota bacterium]
MSALLRMQVELGPLRLQNPVVAASGTFGYGEEFSPFLDLDRLGGFVVKGLSLRARQGNPYPRTCETPSGMLNSIGLQNIGIDSFLQDKLPRLRHLKAAVIANLYGESLQEFEELAERIEDSQGLAAVELNLSCPNTPAGGMCFGVDEALTEQVVGAVRRRLRLPLIVKLTPNVTHIERLAEAARRGGADILSLVNTFLGMAIDPESRRPRLATICGGLSGPAIRPLAVCMVRKVARQAGLPIMGMGGIECAADAIEFLLAGASAVQVGTANFYNPASTIEILSGLAAYCQRHQIEDIHQLVGALETGPQTS